MVERSQPAMVATPVVGVCAGRQAGRSARWPERCVSFAASHRGTTTHTRTHQTTHTSANHFPPIASSGTVRLAHPPMERRVARSRLSRVWPLADIEWFGVFLTPLFAACSLSTSNRSRIVLGLLPPPHVFASRSLILISGPHTMVCNMAEHTMLSLRRSPALRCLLLHTRSMPFGGTFCIGNRNRCPVPFTHSLALEQNNTSPTKSRAVTHL